jgi:hypothetical protein
MHILSSSLTPKPLSIRKYTKVSWLTGQFHLLRAFPILHDQWLRGRGGVHTQEFKVSKNHGTMEAWAGNYSSN